MARVTEQQQVDAAIRRKNQEVAAEQALEAEVWTLLNTDIFKAAVWEEAHEAIVKLVQRHAASTPEQESGAS